MSWIQRGNLSDPPQTPLQEPMIECLARKILRVQHETSAFGLLTLWVYIFLFFFFLINLFICLFVCFLNFWLCWVVIAVGRLSLVAVSRGYSSLQCVGFSLRWLLLLWSTGSRHAGFSSCGLRAPERRLSSCGARA